jgi:hypothetical protein
MDLMNGFDFSVLLALALLLGALWLASGSFGRRRGGSPPFTNGSMACSTATVASSASSRPARLGRVFMPPFSGRTVTVLRRTDTVQYVPR